ncbi:flavin reductase family protein [Williamsia deligens]|uniref:Flavin reductase family protein n=1 Tax=Williamsia deligens TaxID=321325 RepID=A0ABW3GFL9_9NOCA|nr:flavin reductase family protein [Williamsia deligens]MCP2196019.1 NADH-FMN oxidoreductase RutF, flavin reductase (DIM6/NTAB) family [Williamsia deligens]
MNATATTDGRDAAPVPPGLVLRKAFACLPSGVAAICADIDPHPTGMLVSSLTSVSLDPPLLSFCVQNGSRTWAGLKDAPRIGVSFLGDSHGEVCAQFAAAAPERLRGVGTVTSDGGAVLLEGAAATFTCSLHDEFSAGDHSIVVLRIEAFDVVPDVAPLVFHGSRYRRLAG